MAQMPEEGRKFGIVDSYWKDIMGEAVSCQQTLFQNLWDKTNATWYSRRQTSDKICQYE